MGLFGVGSDNEEVRVTWVAEALRCLPSGGTIMDAGAGELRFKPYCHHLKYFAQDFMKYDGKGDGAGLQVGTWDNSKIDMASDISQIPVKSGSFDAVLCTEVLEHVPNPLAAVREFQRILKPRGVLIITAPFCSLTHFAPYHFGGMDRYWYMHHLPLLGFTVDEMSANGSWFAFVAQEIRRCRLVGEMYSSAPLGFVTRLCAIPLLGLLGLLARWDRGSDELLCFGFMVRATKTSESVLDESR